jgi:hypothetical protein
MTTIDGLLVTARVIAWRTILLTLLAWLLYGPAYAVGAAARNVRRSAAWVGATLKVGWADGRRGSA